MLAPVNVINFNSQLVVLKVTCDVEKKDVEEEGEGRFVG
jgi:hypothetical protein